MFIYGLSTEVWKLESKLELFKKQMEIKQNEMEKVNDKVRMKRDIVFPNMIILIEIN